MSFNIFPNHDSKGNIDNPLNSSIFEGILTKTIAPISPFHPHENLQSRYYCEDFLIILLNSLPQTHKHRVKCLYIFRVQIKFSLALKHLPSQLTKVFKKVKQIKLDWGGNKYSIFIYSLRLSIYSFNLSQTYTNFVNLDMNPRIFKLLRIHFKIELTR